MSEKYYRFFLKWGSHFVTRNHGWRLRGQLTALLRPDKFNKARRGSKLKNYFKSKFESFGVQFAADNLATDRGEQTSDHQC